MHTCIHAYVRTYIHAYMHRYVHTCTYIYIYMDDIISCTIWSDMDLHRLGAGSFNLIMASLSQRALKRPKALRRDTFRFGV